MSYRFSFELADQQIDIVHAFLAGSYWAQGIPRHIVERAVANSLCIATFDAAGDQVGFARVVTDRATMAYLADVFVLPEFQGQGIGKSLIETIVGHPRVQGLRRWVLATKDAHGLYAQYGFTPLAATERWMERFAEQPSG